MTIQLVYCSGLQLKHSFTSQVSLYHTKFAAQSYLDVILCKCHGGGGQRQEGELGTITMISNEEAGVRGTGQAQRRKRASVCGERLQISCRIRVQAGMHCSRWHSSLHVTMEILRTSTPWWVMQNCCMTFSGLCNKTKVNFCYTSFPASSLPRKPSYWHMI